jgi:hypothetical protein
MEDMKRPGLGRFSEEAADASSSDMHERREGQDQDAGWSDKRREFESKQEEAEQNAEQAGVAAARRLGEGFLQGIGRRVGELVWDALTGGHGS